MRLCEKCGTDKCEYFGQPADYTFGFTGSSRVFDKETYLLAHWDLCRKCAKELKNIFDLALLAANNSLQRSREQ